MGGVECGERWSERHAEVRITRHDAECLLLTAKILLKYANELLAEK